MSTPEGDVPTMMARVRATLDSADSSHDGASGIIRVPPEGDPEVNVARMRRRAEIDMTFLSGSDRAVLGPAVRFVKRAVRRSLGWYLTPMMAQQSRFNHATLDAIEQLRLRVDKLGAELERIRTAESNDRGDKPPQPPDDAAPTG